MKGGLGNQLFQYALGRRLAIVNNDILKIDISGLSGRGGKKYISRNFMLDKFNIKAELASERECANLKYPHGLISYCSVLIKNFFGKNNQVTFNKNIFEIKKDCYLDGFWQSPLYFNCIRDILLNELTPKNKIYIESLYLYKKIDSLNSVSLHVRRGDYIENIKARRQIGECSLEYYKTAINKIKSVVKDAVFYVFSDDLNWAAKNFKDFPEIKFMSMDNIDDVEQFWLMKSCKHNIISNSSYSWWAAWLNSNENKVVVAPKNWFNKLPYDPDLLPSSWVLLEK
jgi:hypothetical protein